MNCPLCLLPMKEIHDRGVEIDVCANKHTFFDKFELSQTGEEGEQREQQLRHAVRGRTPGDDAKRCGRCRAPMVEISHGLQRAAVCTSCAGVLLWSVQAGDLAMAGGAMLGAAAMAPPSTRDRAVDAGFGLVDVGIGGLDVAEAGLEVAVEGGGYFLLEFVFEVLGALLE